MQLFRTRRRTHGAQKSIFSRTNVEMLMTLWSHIKAGDWLTRGGGVRLQQRDSQVLQRVQAREGLLGHRADLVPLQEPGEKPQHNLIRFSPGGRGVTPRRSGTYSLFSFSRAEKGPFMSSMVQEISFFWRSLQTETKRPHGWKDPRPANNCGPDVKTLCGFTFRVKRSVL